MVEPAEQWIPAAQARELLGSPPNDLAERIAICTRAHAGLLKARAELVVTSGRKFANSVLPPEFWWADGEVALEQDWATGDFATWMDSANQWRAFGVHFALDGLLQMLPIEQRAIAARGLSVVGKAGWLSAREARRFAYDQAAIVPHHAASAILDACRLGYVTARAVLFRRADEGRPENWSYQEREWVIPVWFWDEFTLPDSSSQDWERGNFSGKGKAPEGRCWITLTGAFFLAESLNLLLPEAARTGQPSPPTPNPGGRPRKDFWDDLWNAVWGQVYHGDLLPKRQADLERAMLNWATANSHELSESTVKPLARKMFATMQGEGKNRQ